MAAKKIDTENNINYFDEVSKAGWEYFHYEDGSGHFRSPDGKKELSFDLATYEHKWNNGEWITDLEWHPGIGAKQIYEEYLKTEVMNSKEKKDLFSKNISWKSFSQTAFEQMKHDLFDFDGNYEAGTKAIDEFYGRVEVGDLHIELIPRLDENNLPVICDEIYYPEPDPKDEYGKTKKGLHYEYTPGATFKPSDIKNMDYEEFKNYISNHLYESFVKYHNSEPENFLERSLAPTIDWDSVEKGSPLYKQLKYNEKWNQFSHDDFEKLKNELISNSFTAGCYGQIEIGDIHADLWLWEDGSLSIENYFPGTENKHKLLEAEYDEATGLNYYEINGNSIDLSKIKDMNYDQFTQLLSEKWLEQIISDEILLEHASVDYIDWDDYNNLISKLYNAFLEKKKEPVSIHDFINNEFKDVEYIKSLTGKHSDFILYLQLQESKYEDYLNRTHEFDFNKLADDIIQSAYEASGSGFNSIMDYENVAALAGKDKVWVFNNIDNIREALSEHNDNELLGYSDEIDYENEEQVFNLNFCSIGEDVNELFKKVDGRWTRRSNNEIYAYENGEFALKNKENGNYVLVTEEDEITWKTSVYDSNYQKISEGVIRGSGKYNNILDILDNEYSLKKWDIVEYEPLVLTILDKEAYDINITNEILDKIRAAGIEVVTDKNEFDSILDQKEVLQKMSDKPIEEETNPLFLADENELKAFAQKVDDWKAGNLSSNEIITEFSTSTVLQAINIPANKIAITQERLEKINAPETQKIGNSRGHDIDIETIKQIPKFLANPVMVFNSSTRSDSFTVMTEAVDKNNETILIALQISKKQGSIIVNEITSAYGKDENEWFIEQIKLGNLVYENKQKSLEWSHRRGFLLPTRMTTQGSLNVIQKEDIVNKRTPNFALSERNIEFTENQQEFLKEIGFTNSLDSDGNPINFSFEKKDSKNNKNIFIKKYLNSYNIGEYSCSVTENDSLVYEIKEDEVTHFNPSEIFLLRASSMDMKDNFIIPVETLGKIFSDSTLQISRGFISSNYSQMNRMDYYDILKSTSFKNKVSNLPAKFISEDIYSANLNTGKILTYVLHDNLMESVGFNRSSSKEHFLLEIQTDNNYEKVPNKDYPRLYIAKWDRASKAYIDKTEIPLSDLDSKTLDNIQYIAVNNCNTELAKPVQTMTLEDGSVYGFVHNDKIYLNPEFMNSNAAVHEYTHLWDAYTQKTNPELWNKGLEIFKDTKYWNEVISDPNYQDIKDDENLVLSEIHSRICGDIAEKVLDHIFEIDGEHVKIEAINWNEETWNYICKEMMPDKTINYENKLSPKDLHEFLAMPMKDLMEGKNISMMKEKESMTIQTEVNNNQERLSEHNDEIIRNLAKKRDDAIEEKKNNNEKKLEEFKAEVKTYSPLIKELIKAGNTLLENGFDLEGWRGHTGKYSDGSFIADGWTHKFGFKSSNGKITAVGRSLGDDGDKYYIYSDGENIEIGPYTFRYEHDYDWEPKNWLKGIQEFKTVLSEKFGLNFDYFESIEKEKDNQKIEINGISMDKTDIEKDAREIIIEAFRALEPSPELKDLVLYKPEEYGFEKDDKLHILIEYEEKGWSEDNLFNALSNVWDEIEVSPYFTKDGNNFFNYDFNTITEEKSGNIESYLKSLSEQKNISLTDKSENLETVIKSYDSGNYVNPLKKEQHPVFKEIKEMLPYCKNPNDPCEALNLLCHKWDNEGNSSKKKEVLNYITQNTKTDVKSLTAYFEKELGMKCNIPDRKKINQQKKEPTVEEYSR